MRGHPFPQDAQDRAQEQSLGRRPSVTTRYTDEEARDAVAAMIAAGTHTGISFSYNDSADSLSATVTGGGGGATRGLKITQDNTAVSTSSNIPFDSTIPQNTEGAEYTQIATSYTPTDAASILEIEVFITGFAGSTGGNAVGALFVDSTANALAVANVTPAQLNFEQQMFIKYSVVAGSTSARTYKFRYGYNTGTMYINRRNDNATPFSNLFYSHMKITEFAP